MKVSGALADSIRTTHHHCAGPDPPRAISGPHGLRDGVNLDFLENETTLSAVPPLIKELLIMTHVLTILHITCIMEASGHIDTYHTQTMITNANYGFPAGTRHMSTSFCAPLNLKRAVRGCRQQQGAAAHVG